MAGPLISVSDDTPGPGDTTPQVIPSTGGHSHAGPGGQRPSCRTAKNITGEVRHLARATTVPRTLAAAAAETRGAREPPALAPLAGELPALRSRPSIRWTAAAGYALPTGPGAEGARSVAPGAGAA